MHNSTFLTSVAFLLLCISWNPIQGQKNNGQVGTIICKVIAFRNTDGNIQMTLYNKAKGFPEDLDMSLLTRSVRVINKAVTEVRFENLPYGTYALAGLHDEDFSTDMDFNWLGLPREGYCFSNDAKPLFSAPSFNSCKLELKTKEKVLYITMQY